MGLELTESDVLGLSLTGLPEKRFDTHADLQLNKLKVTAYPFACLDIEGTRKVSRENGLPEFDGVLGSEVLAILRAEIDYDRLTLKLRRPER